MKIHDFLLGLLIVVVSVVVFMIAKDFPDQNDGKPGAWLYPCALSILFFGCGVVLTLKSIKKLKEEPLIVFDKSLSKSGVFNICVVIACIAFYIEVSDYLGFLITMCIVLLAMFAMMRNKIIYTIIGAPLATVVIYLIFAKGLLVPLPEGLFYF